MSNKLLSMSLQELWRLFPIRLVPHDPRWSEYFRREREILRGLLQDTGETKIHHIGSTAVSGIWAKPIVDILIEYSDVAAAKQRLIDAGYLLMSEKGSRCSLNKGYTEAGLSCAFFTYIYEISAMRMRYFLEIFCGRMRISPSGMRRLN